MSRRVKVSELKIGDRFYDADGDLAEYIGHEREKDAFGAKRKTGHYTALRDDGSVLVPMIQIYMDEEVELVD